MRYIVNYNDISHFVKGVRQELSTGFLIEQEKQAGEVTPWPVPLQGRDRRVVPAGSSYRSSCGD
jgi:hypothetical protein